VEAARVQHLEMLILPWKNLVARAPNTRVFDGEF
jgi:hypothetical protein